MPLYTKDSLELLRKRVDLVEVLSSYLPLERSGAFFRALCPFHEEKSASFVVRRGEGHYHCFGCGAHGDAISFLIHYLKVGFVEAVEQLAERSGVHLEREVGADPGALPTAALKEALQLAAQLYHFFLLYTSEGHRGLHYLYGRQFDLPMVRRFEVGYAPCRRDILRKFLAERGIGMELMRQAGLISSDGSDFFSDRIIFPIRNGMGQVVAFSARRFQEGGLGAKYINSPETLLFKKSHLLFGLSYSRKKIVEGRRALIVEGQIDCLRAIEAGFDYTVAGQGTAFGAGHLAALLKLGVERVLLAFDSDRAGRAASLKVGELFQSKGIEVGVVLLPSGYDPDSFIMEKKGASFAQLLQEAVPYLNFWVQQLMVEHSAPDSPAGKAQMMRQLVERIRRWEDRVMIHESIKRVAALLQLPEELVDLAAPLEKQLSLPAEEGIDGDKILESDLIRILFLSGEKGRELCAMAKANLAPSDLKVDLCRRLYGRFIQSYDSGEEMLLLNCLEELEQESDGEIMGEIMRRKIDWVRSEKLLLATIRRILERNWMEERELIKVRLSDPTLREEDLLQLAKEFDALKKRVPQIS